MDKIISAIPFLAFLGVGVFALTGGYFITAAFCLVAAFLCVNLVDTTK